MTHFVLRLVTMASDTEILECTNCTHVFGSPSGGYCAGQGCPFCRSGKLRVSTTSVQEVFSLQESLA